MALTNKTIASTYGDILQTDNSGSGRTANGTNIKDGLGQSTALTLGQNKLHIKPSSDQTDAVVIETSGGTDLLQLKAMRIHKYKNLECMIYNQQQTLITQCTLMLQ
jgi:hypothetical protein